MNHRSRQVLAATALAIAAAASCVRSVDAATLEGVVSFSNDGGSTTSGGSGVFSMSLPAGASCQGSGATGYRWETMLLSPDVDVAALTFSNGPDPVTGKFVTPLFDAFGEQVSKRFPSNSPLGLISGIPGISLANTVAGRGLSGIPVGTYRIGIACTYNGSVQEHWLTTIDVSADAVDAPLGIRWVTSSGPTTTTSTTPVTSSTTAATTTTIVTSTTAAGNTTTSTSSTLSVHTSTPPTTEPSKTFPVTGSSSSSLALAAGVAIYFGRLVILSARRVKVLPPQ